MGGNLTVHVVDCLGEENVLGCDFLQWNNDFAAEPNQTVIDVQRTDSMTDEWNCFSSSCGRLNFLSWRRKNDLCWAWVDVSVVAMQKICATEIIYFHFAWSEWSVSINGNKRGYKEACRTWEFFCVNSKVCSSESEGITVRCGKTDAWRTGASSEWWLVLRGVSRDF